MLTPKEALLKDGKVEVKSSGRGRMSKAQTDRVKELVAEGWDIKGYAVSKSTTKTVDAPVTVTKVSDHGKTIADLPPMRYDETMWKAVSETPFLGHTEFGMREVCRCGSSLTYHYCDHPVIFGSLPVSIVPR